MNKAGRLAAEQHLILKNPKIPGATAVKMLKPLAREQTRLAKRIRLGPTPAATAPAPNEVDEENGGKSVGKHVEKYHQRNDAETKSNTSHTSSFGNRVGENEASLTAQKKPPLPESPF